MRLSHSFSSMKMYENCPLRYYYQRISKEVQDQPGEASLYGERIHKHLEDRLKDGVALPDESGNYEKLAAQIEAKAAGKTLLLEQELTLNENLTPTGWWDKDAWMRSKLDVLVLHKDRAFVGDWKTGKRRPDFFQLELFALQVFAHYEQVQTVTSAFIWLKDNAIDAETYNRDEEPVLWSKMLGKVTRIAESAKRNKWPAKPSGLCPYCPAKDICEYR